MGKARCCGSKIPFFYVGAEIIAAALVGAAAFFAGAIGIFAAVALLGAGTWFVAVRRREDLTRTRSQINVLRAGSFDDRCETTPLRDDTYTEGNGVR